MIISFLYTFVAVVVMSITDDVCISIYCKCSRCTATDEQQTAETLLKS